MRLIVAHGANFDDSHVMEYCVDMIRVTGNPMDEILLLGEEVQWRGAKRYADNKIISSRIFNESERNEILEKGQGLAAFWDGEDTALIALIKECLEAGMPVWVFDYVGSRILIEGCEWKK